METCKYGSEAGCRKPTTERWNGADCRAYGSPIKKIGDDMYKLSGILHDFEKSLVDKI